MKLLALVFLVGFALVSAVPVPSHDLSLKEDDLEYMLALAADDDDIKTELGKKLKEHLDEILERVKDAVDHGKTVKEEYMKKLKEIHEKLGDLKVEIGEKGKELLEKIKEKSKDFWQKITDMFKRKDKRSIDMMMEDEDDIKTELGKKLRESLDQILEKMKDAIDHGKTVKEETLEKVKKIQDKLNDLKVDLGAKAKEILKNIRNKFEETKEKLKESIQDHWQKILDLFKPKEARSVDMHVEALMMEDEDPKTELGKKLQEHLDKILKEISDAIDHGKNVKEETIEKMKQIREKLRDMKIDLREKTEKLINEIKEKAKNFWQNLLDKLKGKDKRSIDMGVESMMMEAEDDETKKKLREQFEEILEKFKDAIEHGKTVKEDVIERLKDISEKMKKMNVELGKHAKEILEHILENVKNFWEKILGKKDGETMMMADEENEAIKSLRESLSELLEEIKLKIEKGRHVFIYQWTEVLELAKRLADSGVGVGERMVEMVDEMLGNMKDGIAKTWLKRIRDMFKPKEQRAMPDFREMLRKLREKVRDAIDADDIKAKIEDLFGKHSELAQQLRDRLKDKGEGWKQRIMDFIDRIIPDKKEKRSIKDIYEKVKEYLKNLQIDLKEKFVKFGEWAKDKYEKGLEKGKDRAESLKKLAREFIDDAKNIGKDVAEQAKEFFKEYKDDLGTVYDDVRQKIKEILEKN